jgi:hypothetical protein
VTARLRERDKRFGQNRQREVKNMGNNIERRIQQLEARTIAAPIRVMFVSSSNLPLDYSGETYTAMERAADGTERFEERPGPRPAGAPNLDDFPDPSYSLVVRFVRPPARLAEAL